MKFLVSRPTLEFLFARALTGENKRQDKAVEQAAKSRSAAITNELALQRRRNLNTVNVLLWGIDEESKSSLLTGLHQVVPPHDTAEAEDFEQLTLEALACVPDTKRIHEDPSLKIPYTPSVIEHRFRMEHAFWAPYCENLTAGISLVPVDGFDETVYDWPKKSHFSEVFQAWSSITSQVLLRHVDFIVYFTNCNTLRAKLDAGIQFSRYMPSYTWSINAESALPYIRMQFRQ
ncbi:hypothetical protein HGRIS_010591 [Hohenbuehelia grisea]|uniref:Uncharacterized protein n=1 Tax=Hohenbuehelia grisea TaxID=104357 RepID=A0ABR3IXX0_9AGAR